MRKEKEPRAISSPYRSKSSEQAEISKENIGQYVGYSSGRSYITILSYTKKGPLQRGPIGDHYTKPEPLQYIYIYRERERERERKREGKRAVRHVQGNLQTSQLHEPSRSVLAHGCVLQFRTACFEKCWLQSDIRSLSRYLKFVLVRGEWGEQGLNYTKIGWHKSHCRGRWFKASNLEKLQVETLLG